MAKTGRNDPCPCGSGKKYKHCCRNAPMNPMDEFKADLQARDGFEDEAEIGESIEAWNQGQREDVSEGFEGLTPDQMHTLLYASLQSPGLIQFQSGLVEEDGAPIMILLSELLEAIGEKGLKPTATGNLPRNVCRDIALTAWGEEGYQQRTKFSGINSEKDFPDLHKVRVVAELAGMIRQYKGRFIIGRKTRQTIADHGCGALYPELFRTFVGEFNWAYDDRLPELFILQQSFAFTLFLFHRHGDQFRPIEFYSERLLDAFPAVVAEAADEGISIIEPEQLVKLCYENRIIMGSLAFLGLLEVRPVDETETRLATFDVRRTALMERFVTFGDPLSR